MYPGGTWTGSGPSPNFLYSEAGGGWLGCINCPLHTPMYTATGYNVQVIESGPLKVVLKANYTFNRPKYAYGPTIVTNAGPGHYTIILSMYANSKSILIDEDSDMQFSYYVPVNKELAPDQARYRGQDSSSQAGLPDPICG